MTIAGVAVYRDPGRALPASSVAYPPGGEDAARDRLRRFVARHPSIHPEWREDRLAFEPRRAR